MIRLLLPALCLALTFAVAPQSTAATSVLELGLKGNGETDDTDALSKAFAEGQLDLHFPAGTYLFGTIELPNDAHLHFSPKARLKVDAAKIQELKDEETKGAIRPLFLVKGNRVVVEGLDAAGVFDATSKDSRGRARQALTHLIFGEDASDLTFSRLWVKLVEKKARVAPPSRGAFLK